MIGQMGLYPADSDNGSDDWKCYLHGYVSSRLMKTASSPSGLPICIAATKVDGYVLSLTPFSHSCNYRSAVLQGTATVVEDTDEKVWALKLITDGVVPGRWEDARTPPDGAELQSTRVLKVEITSAGAKIREGGPKDERKDLKREEVVDRIWTGVVPVYESFGEPAPSSYNRVQEVPQYLREFVNGKNEDNQRYATEVAAKELPGRKKKQEE